MRSCPTTLPDLPCDPVSPVNSHGGPFAMTCLIAMSHFLYAISGGANLVAIGYYSYR
jgi:hypothetical protein